MMNVECRMKKLYHHPEKRCAHGHTILKVCLYYRGVTIPLGSWLPSLTFRSLGTFRSSSCSIPNTSGDSGRGNQGLALYWRAQEQSVTDCRRSGSAADNVCVHMLPTCCVARGNG